MKKHNVVLSVDESEVLKYYCQQEGIKFFRTEYWDKRYCQLEMSEEQSDGVEQFLNDLEFVINDSNNLIAIFNHSEEYYSIVDCLEDVSFAGSFYDVVEELSGLLTDAWLPWFISKKCKANVTASNTEKVIRKKFSNKTWYEFFYGIAEYGNENWKGFLSARELATAAFTYFEEFVESMMQGKFTHTINELHKNLCEDWQNGSDEARELATEIDSALNNALQIAMERR